MLTAEQFRAIFPKLAFRLQEPYFNAIVSACSEFAITTGDRIAAHLAQVGHETMGLVFLQELGGDAYFTRLYENRADLGNVQPGDGTRFHGRGTLQLTGRENYDLVGRALGLNLLELPDLAADPPTAARIGGYFWKQKGLNELADVGDFTTITKRINGGMNGFENRKRLWEIAKRILGV